jgi:serine/threonine-protein kinase
LVRCDGVFEDLRRDVLGLVMDFVEGRSLKSLLGDPRLDARATMLGLRHLAGALAYLHGRRVVHRDLKLENVVVDQRFFSEPEQADHIKLVDFGIAISSDAASRLTMVGGVVGTPPYLAPELLDPATFPGDQIAPAVDIFAFGVLASLLITGKHPSGLSPGSGVFQYAECYRQANRGELEFPAQPVSGALGRVIGDCVAVRSSERIGDGRELSLRLQSLELDTSPTSRALPDSPTAVASPVAMHGDTEPAVQPAQQSRRSSLGAAAVTVGSAASPAPPARRVPFVIPPEDPPPSRAGLWIVLGLVSVALALAAVWFVPPMLAAAPSAVPLPPPLPTLSSTPDPVLDDLDAGADADASDAAVLPDGCSNLCDCCPSGSGCGAGSCDDPLAAHDRFQVRAADVDLQADNAPEVTTCIRLAREGTAWVCDPERGLTVSHAELVMYGIEISARTEGDAAVVWSKGGQFDGGLRREVLCRGLEVKPTGGYLPATRFRLYLDPPGKDAPARCLVER